MESEKNRGLVEAYQRGYHPTGQDYEQYLAWELHAMGYHVKTTRATKDFGTDVILDLNRYFRVIFQCKYYSSKIGNHAVQEICAAKEYYKAQLCVVITNQTYTDAAVDLALVNHVLLIANFDIGSDIGHVCSILGLIPQSYLDRNALCLNDAMAERDLVYKQNQVLLEENKELFEELLDYRTSTFWNDPYDDPIIEE